MRTLSHWYKCSCPANSRMLVLYRTSASFCARIKQKLHLSDTGYSFERNAGRKKTFTVYGALSICTIVHTYNTTYLQIFYLPILWLPHFSEKSFHKHLNRLGPVGHKFISINVVSLQWMDDIMHYSNNARRRTTCNTDLMVFVYQAVKEIT